MVKNYLFRINSANLWGAWKDFDLYPKILKNFEKGKIENKSDIKNKLWKHWDHREIKDKKLHGRTANSGLIEYLFGIDIDKEQKGKEISVINNRGVNIFDKIPYKNEMKLSEEGAELRDLYFENESSDDWKIKLLELFLKYDVRLRVLLLNILFYKHKLKYFKKKSKFNVPNLSSVVLNTNEIYLEDPQLEEKIYIFKDRGKLFNQLLTENQYEIIGPFLREKFIDFYDFEICSDDNITITGFRGEPNTSAVYNQLKKLIIVMIKLDLVINDNQFFQIDIDRFSDIFPQEIVQDFIILKNRVKRKKQDISEEFYTIFKKYCENDRDPIDKYIPIGRVYLKVCKELGIISEKEKFFCKLFYSLNKKKFNIINKRKGLLRLGSSPCGDKDLNKWKIEFF